ncbi:MULTISPECIES: ApeA N-terminal domain 1-containing protein [Paraburkholderia]|uniref:ApeA N-terminal domain 1-containing protein n=1 Tax=Paraburkholderia TaxID=1822464 RepID=UPI00225475EE|nr:MULTISPECIES: HEPN domain-containing protein [Paraburkholderia]MCX4156163.1 hypothetical protein [Paraburkholderia aspalathi]MDN7165569.1 hypothetical protein [Paraburkholderia sp. SECH2]MDQ6394055.1 hypothetical protein [Paraburkholderia aspalathi]
MTKSRKKKLQTSGVFTAPDGQEVFGNLHLKGRNTLLHLHLKRELSPLAGPAVINGELVDLRKVSCLQCIVGSISSGNRGEAGQYHFAEIFPHFVTIGDRHIAPDEPSIKAVQFTTQDVPLIFYDFDAFGHLFGSKSIVESLLKESKPNREITFGESPQIFYFSGKHEVIAVETPMGLVRVSHRPTFSIGGSTGELVTSRMVVTLEYAEPVAFEACIEGMMSLNRFLGLVAGRKQSIESVSLDLADSAVTKPMPLELHWVFAPKRPNGDDRRPEPGDIPLDAVRRPEEFKDVLRNWLNRESEWRAARIRYAACVGKGGSYDIDRLVAAANLFDILPQDAVPPASDLSQELTNAQKESREIFRRLNPGVERNSVLGALGRMNKPSLTRKVLHRVGLVTDKLAERFPDLALVASTAVKVRNFFVHGSSDGLDYQKLEPLMPFLTDALEFIFATSDLIDAGWDAIVWGNQHYGFGHSFTRFRWGYLERVALLKEALS